MTAAPGGVAASPSRAIVRPGRLSKVLIVDGSRDHRHDMVVTLHSAYEVEDYSDPRLALRAACASLPDLVIIDEFVPPVNGLAVIDAFRNTPAVAHIPFIATTSRPDSDFLVAAQLRGAQAVLAKPFRIGQFLQAVSQILNQRTESRWATIEPVQQAALRNTLALFNSIADTLTGTAEMSFEQVKEGCAPLVEAVSNACFRDVLSGVRDYDNYTYAHSLRVATFLSMFGHRTGLRGNELKILTAGGLMHDVGKIGIPHSVLNKPGKLTAEEWLVMRSHVDRTMEILKQDMGVPRGALIVAGQHHEKLDGSGYPHGLKGEEINVLARMAAICDIFSALTDRRVYKDPMPAEEALKIMQDMSGAVDMYLLGLFREMMLDMADQIEC